MRKLAMVRSRRQHFLRPAKTLSLAQVFRMSDAEAEAMFCKVRWPETDGKPVCPHCGGLDAYECRPSERLDPVPLKSLPGRFHSYEWNMLESK
jgi:hypothetical protein